MRSRIVLALLALSLLVIACGDGGAGTSTSTPAVDTTTTTIAPETPTTTLPAAGGVIDWDDRAMTVELADGWSVAHCEVDAPFLCVAKDGDVVGLIEWFIADPNTYDAYDPATDDETNLRAVAADFIEALAADRADGCGADYDYQPIEPTTVTLGGADGIVYGFRGTLGDGTASEYNLQFSALSDGRLLLMVAAGYDDGGCPGRDEMISFDSATLEEFRPHLEALLAESPLPGGDEETGLALADGYTFAWILSVDGGLVVDPALVLSGEEARLQAVADGVIPADEDLPNDVYLYNPTEERLRVRVADDVSWLVLAPGADGALAARESDRETIASILAGGDTGDIYGLTPEFMPFDLLVINGEVVEISERYLP